MTYVSHARKLCTPGGEGGPAQAPSLPHAHTRKYTLRTRGAPPQTCPQNMPTHFVWYMPTTSVWAAAAREVR